MTALEIKKIIQDEKRNKKNLPGLKLFLFGLCTMLGSVLGSIFWGDSIVFIFFAVVGWTITTWGVFYDD